MARTMWILALGGLMACGGGGGDVTGPPPDPAAAAVGSYSITRINGVPLPGTVFSNSAGSITVNSGGLVLRSDHSYTETEVKQIHYVDGTTNAATSVIENGTFAVTGSQITFTIPADVNGPALSYTGAVSGNVVSYTYNGNSYEFTKP